MPPPWPKSAAARAWPPGRWHSPRLSKKIAPFGRHGRGDPSADCRILAANAEDIAEARAAGTTGAFLDRLTLDPARVEAIAEGIEVVRALKDPVGTVTESWTRPNGMRIERVRVPLGVIGIIYESRPNVTADAGALCLKVGQRRDPARRLR